MTDNEIAKKLFHIFWKETYSENSGGKVGDIIWRLRLVFLDLTLADGFNGWLNVFLKETFYKPLLIHIEAMIKRLRKHSEVAMKITAEDRLRNVAQILIKEIGADVPISAEKAAHKAVKIIRELRETKEAIEQVIRADRENSVGGEKTMSDLCPGRNGTAAEHCYHPDPPKSQKVCCFCGKTVANQLIVLKKGKHGPFVPTSTNSHFQTSKEQKS